MDVFAIDSHASQYQSPKHKKKKKKKVTRKLIKRLHQQEQTQQQQVLYKFNIVQSITLSA
jgi:ATP phosphoribosyltransferase